MDGLKDGPTYGDARKIKKEKRKNKKKETNKADRRKSLSFITSYKQKENHTNKSTIQKAHKQKIETKTKQNK